MLEVEKHETRSTIQGHSQDTGFATVGEPDEVGSLGFRRGSRFESGCDRVLFLKGCSIIPLLAHEMVLWVSSDLLGHSDGWVEKREKEFAALT
jgi:hypothetical protein